MTRTLRRRLCAPVIVAWLAAGCATPVQENATAGEFRFPQVASIGVTSSTLPPAVDTSRLPFAPDSTAQGVVEGAVGGAATGAYACLYVMFPPALVGCLIAAAALGTVAGAATGALAAPGADTVKSAGDSLRFQGQNPALAARLRERIVQIAASRQDPGFVDLGDGDEDTAAGMPGAKYAGLAVDRVLELRLTEITVGRTAKDRFGITMHAVSRLVHTADGAVESLRGHVYISPSRTLSEWQADGARPLREALESGLDELSRDILAERAKR